MKQATFYLLDNAEPSGALSAHEAVACAVAASSFRAGKRVLIACESRSRPSGWTKRCGSASRMNSCRTTAGEGPHYGAPVELCWPGKRGNAPRDLLIALLPQFADFATAFHEVVDFVPYEDTLKQLARDRYKAYRSVGFHLTTATPPTH